MKRKWSTCILALLTASVLCAGCGDGTSGSSSEGHDYEISEMNAHVYEFGEVQLGEPITIDGVLELTLYEGSIYDEFYAENAGPDGARISAEEGETLFGLYGSIKNLSSKKYQISDVMEMTVTIDGEYEYYGRIYPETEDGTSFITDDFTSLLEDEIQPKAERPCVFVSHVGKEVGAEASEATITFDIKKDVDADDNEVKKKYVMNLQIEY